MNNTPVALVELASNSLVFIIAQKTDCIDELERIEHPLSMGKDTFSTGKISYATVSKVCQLIQDFIRLTKAYGVRRIHAYATTAVREAKNKDYILDQINVKTGLPVQVLDDAEEKLIMFRHILRSLAHIKHIDDGPVLIAFIGSGSLGVAVIKDGKIIFNQNILIGSLKLSEIVGEVKDRSRKLHVFIEEYLSSYMNMLKKLMPNVQIRHFVASGMEFGFLARQCGGQEYDNYYAIQKDSFASFFDTIKEMTPDVLMTVYKINDAKAETLLPSMGIYNALTGLTRTDTITSPKGILGDALLFEKLSPGEIKKQGPVMEESAVASARTLAGRYLYDSAHAAFVEELALRVFDTIKGSFGLTRKDRFLLQLACVLHDIGKYVNIKRHYVHSYNIIRASDILGVSEKELDIVANIARFHSMHTPSGQSDAFNFYSADDKVRTSKLVAVIRVADALDRSHTQKVKITSVSLKGNELVIQAVSRYDVLIDKWTFNEKSEFMKEVFGLKAVFRHKKVGFGKL